MLRALTSFILIWF